MRKLIAYMPLICLATSAAPADEAISPDTLQGIKRATVFIRVEAHGQEASGSGFVIAREGARALIATNHHVVTPPATDSDGGKKAGAKKKSGLAGGPERFKDVKITAVFESGTTRERSAVAEVIASDPSRDLAILQVTGVKDLPVPIEYAHRVRPVETMPVYVLGFPFGRYLSTSSASPAITIGKASISSLRLDDNGQLAYVQIDGALNPGNSGGPVIDARGRLIGVAVATIRGSGIGLIIPVSVLRTLLQGRITGESALTVVQGADGKMMARVEMARIDPRKRIRAAVLHYVVLEPGTRPARLGEPLRRHPGCRHGELTLENLIARGEVSVEGTGDKDVLLQASYEMADGEVERTFISRHPLSIPARGAAGQQPAPTELVDPITAGRSPLVGGAFGRHPFRDVAPGNGLLVGLEVGLGKLRDLEGIHALRAVFRDGDTESFGAQRGTNLTRVTRFIARPGYAVGALNVRAGLNADGLSVIFMRIKGERLDPSDAYESDWVGDQRPGARTLLTGAGKPVVGIVGTMNEQNTTGIGLMFDRTAGHPDDAVPGRTRLVGGGFGREPFRDIADAGVLVGLEVGLGRYVNMDVVHSVRAVFRDGERESLGRQRGTDLTNVTRLVAKPGYAVGAMTVKSGANADGLSLTFMRIKGGGLDPGDAYESEWLGDTRPGAKKVLPPNGKLVIGIFGTQNSKNITGIGLLLEQPAEAKQPRQPRLVPPKSAPTSVGVASKLDDVSAGLNALEDNHLDKAIEHFTAVIKAHPARTAAYVLRGVAWGSKNQFNKAVADFSAALQADPECLSAHFYRAGIYERKGQIDKAIAEVSAALAGPSGARVPNPSQAAPPSDVSGQWGEKFLILRGHLHHRTKDYRQAIADYSLAIEMNPRSAVAYSARASAHRPLRQYAKCIADDEEAIRLAPGFHGPYTNLAWLFATCIDPHFRDGKKALDNARQACKLTKYLDANDLENLAAAHAELGEFAEAVKWQTKAIELATDYGEPSLQQARLRLKMFGEKKPYRDETDDETIVPKDAPGEK